MAVWSWGASRSRVYSVDLGNHGVGGERLGVTQTLTFTDR